ncbi:casein kinase II subunit beta'-like [Drosophila miranda]|uniref:casein kinase II subunit beta'-like n=1 Tax=Drosophila miranda TaxID=7229 RepID=UPI0007E6F602|nr:casein kinase II subunit beta'-like [Drosophila miranda]
MSNNEKKKCGNEFFTMVNEDYIHDKFNLIFLDTENYRSTLEVIPDLNSRSGSHVGNDHDVDASAEKLCKRIHARFELMLKKFQRAVFAPVYCPNCIDVCNLDCALLGTNYSIELFAQRPSLCPSGSYYYV